MSDFLLIIKLINYIFAGGDSIGGDLGIRRKVVMIFQQFEFREIYVQIGVKMYVKFVLTLCIKKNRLFNGSKRGKSMKKSIKK